MRQPWLWLAMIGMIALNSGCLPGMRDNEPLDIATGEEADAATETAVSADTAMDGLDSGDSADAVDTSVIADSADSADSAETADSKDSQDSAGKDSEPAVGIPGCVTDGQCAGLPFGPCQQGVCNLKSGFCEPSAAADGQACSADACTTAATCQMGECSGKALVCDDGSACTEDSCDLQLGCVYAPLTKACDDGNKCSSGDACVAGKCAGTLKNCDDGNLCTQDLCNGNSGECNHKPVSGTQPCEGLNPKGCSGPASCQAGSCTAAFACDDGNPCTFDLCENGNTCKNMGIAGSCVPAGGPANPCFPGQCQLQEGLDLPVCVTAALCQDKLCNTTKCSGGTCSWEKSSDGAPCDDGNLCSANDACLSGGCKGSKISCDDGNPCTSESCQAGIGCVAAPYAQGAPCEDGSGCTAQDQCKDGVCAGTAIGCDDKLACTQDACDKTQGCVHVKGEGCP